MVWEANEEEDDDGGGEMTSEQLRQAEAELLAGVTVVHDDENGRDVAADGVRGRATTAEGPRWGRRPKAPKW